MGTNLCEIDGSALKGTNSIYQHRKLHLHDKPVIYNKHKQIYKILAKINQAISMKNATKSILEMGAKSCELYGEIFPKLFPDQPISRKGHVLSVVFPKYVRSGTVYRYLKIEHAGENIHAKYNRLEKKT